MLPMLSKSSSLAWITLAYICAIGVALAWLHMVELPTLLNSLIADLLATLVIFSFSRSFKNSSFYDAYWSLIPPLFLVYWWLTRSQDSEFLRYLLVSIVVWFWALRLTWNWGKHWPGMHHEDWRYPMLKQQAGGSGFFIDLFGIHVFPTIQVFLGMLPIYAAVALSGREVSVLDWIAVIAGVSATGIQLISDRHLWRHIETNSSEQVLNTGIWGWSRHPNYFGEILFWSSLALFGLSAQPGAWWWQILGATAMTLMFAFASIPMMEKRSLERRPGYQRVIDNVSMLVPWPPRSKSD